MLRAGKFSFFPRKFLFGNLHPPEKTKTKTKKQTPMIWKQKALYAGEKKKKVF